MTVVAWRYWRIEDLGYDFSAKSWDWVLHGDFEEWDSPLKEAGNHARPLKEAGNHARRSLLHSSPSPDCRCGVNAVKRLRSSDLRARARNGSPVAFAQVDLGGRTDEYDKGYRARQALISGPIYVVNPPERDGWREAIERRYGQPVIVQDLDEALDWIRKDEEANGYRQAHQDARTGSTGSTVNITVAGADALAAEFARAKRALARFDAAVEALARFDAAAEAGRRARARLIARVGAAISIAAVAVFGLYGPLWGAGAHVLIALAWLWLAHRNGEPRPDHVTWDELKAWCLEHGAKNEEISQIEIARGDDDKYVVSISGFELDKDGRKFLAGDNVARWTTTQTLRRLP